ncbi:baseplate J/gp47 family protein [Patulibacter sp. SYSU D01012]|uniref:baseplate J/gp47 family protein n=1 Tax=Patulibacter sp. SYSU D01012 TaxID=2817381 RepID=UPI001B3180EC|nr:baseplate J/gp47 family protein [Patulibacter sp. SYSU D01012]
MSTPLDDDGELLAFGAPIATDADEIEQEIHDEIRDRIPGWDPLPTHPIRHLAGAVAALAADSRDALQAQLRRNLLSLLGMLFGIPRMDGTAASSTVTIRARDTLGHTARGPIPLALGDVSLEIPGDLVVPVGSDTVTVTVICTEPGDAPNGATGTLELDALDWLAETDPVVLDAPLFGGEPAEGDSQYGRRMVDELQTMSRALILPRDYSIAARRHPGIAYAWTLPHYRPGDTPEQDDPNAVFHVATVAANAAGGAISGGTRLEAEADFAARLLDGVTHHLLDPIHVPVDVTAVVIRRAGWEKDVVQAAAEAHLTAVLSPAGWADADAGDDPNPIPPRYVHANELVARLDEPESIDVVQSLKIGDGTKARIDFGVRELPTPGEITVTVIDAADADA